MDQQKPGRCNADESRKRGRPWFCGQMPVKGRARCKRHGGMSPQGLDHPRTKHGLFSGYLKGQLGDRFDAIKADPALGNATEQLAVMTLLLQTRLDRLKDSGPPTAAQQDAIMALSEEIRKITELRDKQTERAKALIPREHAQRAILVFWSAVQAEVTDLALQRRIYQRARTLMAGLGMTAMPTGQQVIDVGASQSGN